MGALFAERHFLIGLSAAASLHYRRLNRAETHEQVVAAMARLKAQSHVDFNVPFKRRENMDRRSCAADVYEFLLAADRAFIQFIPLVSE